MTGKPERQAPLIDQAAYAFQAELTDAIDSYVRELRATQYRGLTYRKVDFGRAIAIELYFRLINDGELLDAYRRYLSGEHFPEDKDLIPLSTFAYWIFRQILNLMPPIGPRRELANYIKYSWKMALFHVSERKKNAKRKENIVLFLALSRRFFDYLLPIRRALKSDVRWLVPAGSDWVAECAAEGEQFIWFDGGSNRKISHPLTQPLAAHWSELATQFDEFQTILQAVKPRAIVVAEGNHTNDELLACAAQSMGIRGVCIQQGWSPEIHTGFRAMHFDTFCAWGQEFAQLLQPYNPGQSFAITGSHRIGPAAINPADKNATTFFLQKSSVLITQRAWTEMLDFIFWTAEASPNLQVLVREHPAAPLTEEEKSQLARAPNIRLCPNSAIGLNELLQKTNIAVAFYSTTLLEALAAGAVPLIINVTGSKHYSPDLAALGCGLEVQDFASARKAMLHLLSHGDKGFRAKISELAPRFFPCSTDIALKNIASEILVQR